MKRLFATAFIFLSTPAIAGFQSFESEADSITNLIKCRSPKITKTDGFPDLYGCIFPGAEVLKVFINAADDNTGVENIKVMWNDWTKDTGYGVHTDKEIAAAWATAIATKYAPEKVFELLEAFRGRSNTIIESSAYTLTYTYRVGPAIDERLIMITEK
jgi:hypothetical protein